MIGAPHFDEVFVVSDLHLGGDRPGKQIFDQGDVFAKFVEELKKRGAGIKQALVINGDLVDFLAESNAIYFDVSGASAKLDRILRDPSFAAVWNSLRSYVKDPDRTLIITLGNHDLEMSLPWVREQLLQELSNGQAGPRSQIRLEFEQGGFRCQVGSASVLCIHGNEVDSWNVTDYESLRRMGQDALRDVTARNWTPNGGTKLVIDVMNEIKAEYPFVDLLKPEEGGVIPTLLVLKPSLAPKIRNAMPAWLRKGFDGIRMATGFLTDEVLQVQRMLGAGSGSTELAMHMLGDVSGMQFDLGSGPAPSDSASFRDELSQDRVIDELLGRTESRLRNRVTAMQLISRPENPEFLGMIGAIWNLVTFKGRSEVLRETLEKLQTDRSFELRTADDTYRALDKKLNSSLDFITAGHTHLHRAIPRGNGRGYYYNSGTWVRLIQVRKNVLSSQKKFEEVYESLSAGSMKALDKHKDLVVRRPTAVRFAATDAGVTGELLSMESGKLETIPGTGYVRV